MKFCGNIMILYGHMLSNLNMASTTRVCCLCRAIVIAKRTVYLFGSSAEKNQWAARISILLEIPVDQCISPYMCQMCKVRLVTLEKILSPSKS